MSRTTQRWYVKIGNLRHTSGAKKDLIQLRKLFGAPKATIHKIKKPYKA